MIALYKTTALALAHRMAEFYAEQIKHLCFRTSQCCACWASGGDFDDHFGLEEQQLTPWAESESKKELSNARYKEIGRGGETVIEDEDAEEEGELDSSFDPDDDYVRNFENLGTPSSMRVEIARSILGVGQIDTIIQESEEVLGNSSMDELTPREVVRNLNKYQSGIRLITDDLEKKKSYIERYEMHKSSGRRSQLRRDRRAGHHGCRSHRCRGRS